MPIPALLAMLPSIFTAISTVSDLFDSGKKVVEAVTGETSKASTVEELQTEVLQLDTDKQEQWAEMMRQKIDLYKAQNQRLEIEQGRIDSNITSKLTSEAASDIAVMRQTTRPWAVRMMVHYVFFPWYLIIIDLIQELLNRWILQGLFRTEKGIDVFYTFTYVFGNRVKQGGEAANSVAANIQALTESATMMGAMYMNSVGWAASIIITYMGLREYSKAKGTSDDVAHPLTLPNSSNNIIETVTGALSNGAELITKIRKAFGK